jgi:hypothetical protein
MSDVTTVYLDGGDEQQIIFAGDNSPLWPVHVQMPAELLAKLDIAISDTGYPILRPAVTSSYGDKYDEFLQDISPLVESGFVLPRARPALFALQRTLDADGARIWKTLAVDPNQISSAWVVNDLVVNDGAIPFDAGEQDTNDWKRVAEIIVPCLTGVSFADLALILQDEHDLLAELRLQIRTLIENAKKSDGGVVDIFNDGVRPATEKVHRKFSTIVNGSRLKIAGAAVSATALGLLALYGFESVGGSAAFGATGVSMLLAREIAEYVKQKGDLRNEPLYLLWRLGQVGR